MGRVNDDKWLEEALNKAIHSDDTRPDFEKWKADHPEAVEMLTSRTPQTQRPPVIRRMIMNATLVKLAAAAVIAIAAIVGITKFTRNPPDKVYSSVRVDARKTVVGPTTHTLADGSSVKLAEGARILVPATLDRRGFRHVAGRIEVTVAKGHGEFVVETLYGRVRALGTQFTMNLLDGVAENTQRAVRILNVEVTEGTVEIDNSRGPMTLKPGQSAVVASGRAPYGFKQDPVLPEGLRHRIAMMIKAYEAGDRAAWAANFNMDYIYKLAKGEAAYDPNLFGGSAEDAERIKQAVASVSSPEELRQLFLRTINITEPVEVYVRSVEVSKDGKHAVAKCIQRKSSNHMVITYPQWHNFDGGWWQVDD